MNKVEMKMADNQTEVQIEVMIEDDHISIPSEYFLPTPSSSIDSDINEIVESSTLNSLMKNNVNDDNNNDDDEITTTNNNSGDNGETINESRQCWVCLASDDEDDEKDTEWIHPCRCNGTAKWVHQNCLQQWIDEKQKYNSSLNVSCTQCNTEYLIVFPQHGKLFYTIELCDRILYSASPLAAITCIVGSIYWSAVCYGAFTIMQVLGKENGKIVIEQSDPLVLLVGLPSIPLALLLSKLIRWEDQILKLWIQNKCRLPLLGYIMGKPAEKSREYAEQTIFARDSMSDPISICRNFCGALILPTAATFIGGIFFDNIKSNFSRAILGGLTFVLAKGFIKILLRQNQYIRQTHRKILNFDNKSETE
ncbi:hypothetical protein DERF_000995 [Dermatophagoides farinae]|uniref:E3 ubiquitin-protein ligase MARCHF5 n=2 Tax=Dermatophagoides farinae TaxID=6954 RepID=A0A922I9P2_DERFA|nr:hypothetical protein DERF_000995 [Dermatophagoides farinae]